ncbi:O-methyltransferase [Sporosarcina limicola]|uniref:tRNA 5-hydroxyuridine methyltransferase n=1 Tax=Sporosarcina limicola TaxID=34101 RepID=A0A927MHB7_9BACL|nr:O-methyltransferase [Sporosarcina limicola]MBE1554630.1 putative O-methyltransferase YrrM [Sporosarcina limicola]
MDKYEQYVASFKVDSDSFIKDMENYAAEHHVPIMDCVGIETFIGLLRIQNPERILEIGSAIGYSAIRIAEALPKTTIVTIERDTKRYTKAVEFIEKKSLVDRIHIIEADALLTKSTEIFNQTYDALFIDAAKGQYQRFFEKYSPVIVSGGVIYCDNMFMHGVVLHEIEEIPRRNRTMIRNLKEFTQWIMAHSEYEASLLPIGDGLLIAVKK